MRKGLFRHVIIKESPDFKTFLMTLRNGQGNIGGKMTDINEFIRDREKQQEENNLKGNNILEVDLLK